MNYQDSNKPDLSVFALALIFVLGIACAMGGGQACQIAAGFVVIGGGGWSTLKVGRWALSRFGQSQPFDPIR